MIALFFLLICGIFVKFTYTGDIIDVFCNVSSKLIEFVYIYRILQWKI